MTTTINGRTPEEIKKGLECCSPRYESKHWVSCSSECPFRNEGVYCRNVLHACNKKYIQLLEDGIDRVYKQVDALRGLPEKIQQLERERDAAVERCVDADDVNAGLYQELKAAQPKWISVEERLPEDGAFAIFYYVKNDKNMMAVGCYFDYGMFIVDGHSVNVTHWMPPPEPPKEDE